MTMRKWSSAISVGVLIVVLGIFAFALYEFVGEAETRESVTHRLKWISNTGFIGDLYAYNYGFFEEAGLEVEVQEGGPESNPIRGLATGRVDFGVASSDQVIKAISSGQKDLVVVAQIYQLNPVRWIYRKDSTSIDSIGDLGKYNIGVTSGDTDESIFDALIRRHKLKVSRLTEVSYSYTPFLRGNVDLFPVYRNTQGVDLRAQLISNGENSEFFNPTNYGVNIASNSIVTTSGIVKNNPEVVRKFLAGLLRGWREALNEENVSKAIHTVIQHGQYDSPVSDSTKSIIRDKITETRRLVYVENRQLGMVDFAAWRQTANILLRQDIIDKKVSIDKYINVSYIPN